MLKELGQYSLQGLRVFAHVASLGSVGEAASALGLTQPAVSLQIHGLENQLGFSLFERKGRRNILTPQGETLFQKLLPHLEKLETVILDAKDSEHLLKPEVNIGAIEGIGEFWLSNRVHEFSATKERLRWDIFLAETEALEQKLIRGEVSIILSARKFEHSRVISQVLMDEKFLPVGRKKAVKQLQETLEASDVERPWEKIDWIGYGDSAHMDKWTLRWLDEVGIVVDRRFKYRHQANSYPVIKQMLVGGLGICVMPLHTCETELDNGQLVTLESKKYPPLKNQIYLSWRDGSLNTIHQQFKDWLVKIAKS